MEKERPKVGVGVIVERGGKILVGERRANHGSATFMIPGGHLEFGETFAAAAMREAEEESGLKNIRVKGVVSVGNDIAYGKHYVSIGILAESVPEDGEPYDAEPEKCGNWRWADPRRLPEPFYEASRKVVENWLSGKICRD